MTKHIVATALSVLILAAIGAPASAKDKYAPPCPGCAPSKNYDSVKVIKTTRDVDQSRVINTTTVVPVYVRPVEVVINFAVQHYRVVERPVAVERVQLDIPEPKTCRHGRRANRDGSCLPVLRVRG